MKWVKQEDENGCWVACMAMLTGKTYAEVKAETFDRYKYPVNDDAVDDYLSKRGFAVQRFFDYDHTRGNYVSNWRLRWDDTPDWPNVPDAPCYLCTVAFKGERVTHYVVMTHDRVVLDPAKAEPQKLTDYDLVKEICAVWKVSQ